MRPLRFLLGAVLALACLLAQAQSVPVPPLTGHVTDQAGMLTAAQKVQLESVLADYEARTGSQIAVLLVKTTEPEAIEQFGIRVVDAWKLGRKGVDDGVLLLVAKDNPPALRRLRIEAGRGVQGVLTDAQSKRVLQDVIAPHFREQRFYDGLVAGVGAIATLLNKEQFPAAATPQGQQDEDEGGLLFPLLIGAFILYAIFRPRRRGRLARGGWGDSATGFIIGSALGSLGNSDSGSSGGGFSGGGGGFDGGGASGDW
jgi:uncharacterized protein